MDEESLLACAAYVDLNPIRTALAETLEQSDDTSVQRRIEAEREKADSEKGCSWAMSVVEYLELLDWTARQTAPGKRGSTPADAPPIVARLKLSPSTWCEPEQRKGTFYFSAAEQIRSEKEKGHSDLSSFPGHSTRKVECPLFVPPKSRMSPFCARLCLTCIRGGTIGLHQRHAQNTQ